MNQNNTFERLLNAAHIGDVEILAEAAAALEAHQAGGGTEELTRELAFGNVDDIHFGVSNIANAPTDLPASVQTLIVSKPANPFKPRAMTLPSDQCIGLYIVQIEYGAFRFIDGAPVHASAHSEVSLNQFIRWPTIQTSQDIKITLLNDTTTAKRLTVDFRGTRARA